MSEAPEADISPIHLDTTILIERLKGRAQKARIDAAIGPKRLKSTSSYAIHELGRTWIRDLAYLLREATVASDTADILDRVRKLNVANTGQKNKLGRCLEMVVEITRNRDPQMTVRDELAFVRTQLTLMIRSALPETRAYLDAVFQGTECWRGDVEPKIKAGNVEYTLHACRPKEIRCAVHKFFVKNGGDFSRIRVRVRASPKVSSQLVSMADAIEEAATSPTALCDDRKCVRMGDAIIARDSNDGITLVANNDAEWSVIADELGRQLINPIRSN